MSTSHLPRYNKERSVRAQKHNLYKTKGKLQDSWYVVSATRSTTTADEQGFLSQRQVLLSCAMPVNKHGAAHETECCCSQVSLSLHIRTRLSSLPAMKRLESKPNILWLKLSRSRTKPQHPKGGSLPQPTPILRGASARRAITAIHLSL